MEYIDLSAIPYNPDGSIMSGDPYAVAAATYAGTPQEWELYSRGIDPKSITPIPGYDGIYSSATTLDGKPIIVSTSSQVAGGTMQTSAPRPEGWSIFDEIGSGSITAPSGTGLPYTDMAGDWRNYGGIYVAPSGSKLYDAGFVPEKPDTNFFSDVISSPAFKAIGLMAGAATGFGALSGALEAGGSVGASELAGGSMDFMDTLDSLLQGGYSNADAWTMAEQLTGGADIGSQIASFTGATDGGLWSSVTSAAKNLGISPESIIKQIGGALASGDKSMLSNLSGLLGMGATGLGSYLAQSSSSDAAQTMADAQIKAAQIAADAAKFKPVGVTTRFGSSNFGYDANGNLTSAGYTLDPTIKAQQDKLLGLSGNYLDQYSGAMGATAPMGTAAQTMFSLGNSYLSTSPQEQAAKYMEEQNALLRPGNAAEYASLQNQLLQQGRLGLATGGEDGLMATNPELAAYQNKLEMQQRQLAAASTQGGMDYAKFGAGMVGSGGQMLQDMYGTQSAAYTPYKTALGGATYLEGLGQDAMKQGMNLGSVTTAANSQSGGLLAAGMNQAAATIQPTDASNPWANFLGAAGNNLQQYGTPYAQPTQPTAFNDELIKRLLGN